MLQQIEECCSLGAHAAVIIPPTWIIRVRRTQVHTHTDCNTNITITSKCLNILFKTSFKMLIQKKTPLCRNIDNFTSSPLNLHQLHKVP